jgi:recombination protein RecT
MTNSIAIIEKIEAVAINPKTKFMQALAAAMPKESLILPPALIRQAVMVIKANDTLQRCSEISLFNSIAEVAQAGLSLDLHLGQCYLVPFSGVATVMYGYRGLQELARRSGEVNEVVGEIRYSKDEFRITLGSDRKLIHIPLDAPPSKRGQPVGAYAIADMKLSRAVFEYMDAEEILKIKNAVVKRAEKKGKQSVWQTEHEMEMWRKTPIRRLAKRLPQSPALVPFVQAAIRDEYRQQGQHQVVEIHPEVEKEMSRMDIDPGPGQGEPRKSEVKEKPQAAQQEEAKGPMTAQQYDALYDNLAPMGLTMQQCVTMMRRLGHKGVPREFPAAKLQDLIGMMEKARKK